MRLPFFKKSAPPPLKKEDASKGIPSYVYQLFDAFGLGITHNFVNPLTAYRFYYNIAPLRSSVSKVAGAIATLPLVMREEDSADVVHKEHPVLQILENPSPLTTRHKFFKNLATSYMISQEMWIIARGRVEREPIELVFVPPYNVEVVTDGDNMWPKTIRTNMRGDRRTFTREEDGARFRYFDRDRMNEIFPYIVENDAVGDIGNFRGVSQLTSIKDELLSYKSSVVNNTKSIEQGVRPGGAITPEDELDEKEVESLEESLMEIQGPYNAGKMVLIPARVKAVFEKWSPKDMDFGTLQKNVKMTIWNLYSIPLPIVSEEGQTFANFHESQTAFYDEAVNDAWGPIADGLRWILSTRYDLDRMLIDYNQFEVPALRRRAIMNTEKMKKSQVFTHNEIRQSAGFEEVSEGDQILVPAREVPLSSVIEGADFDTSPPSQDA